jgi:hypothetical protein
MCLCFGRGLYECRCPQNPKENTRAAGATGGVSCELFLMTDPSLQPLERHDYGLLWWLKCWQLDRTWNYLGDELPVLFQGMPMRDYCNMLMEWEDALSCDWFPSGGGESLTIAEQEHHCSLVLIKDPMWPAASSFLSFYTMMGWTVSQSQPLSLSCFCHSNRQFILYLLGFHYFSFDNNICFYFCDPPFLSLWFILVGRAVGMVSRLKFGQVELQYGAQEGYFFQVGQGFILHLCWGTEKQVYSSKSGLITW